MIVARLSKSPRESKRYRVEFEGKKIDFGGKNSSTFLEHGDEKKRENWVKRHMAANGDKFNNFHTAMAWSYWLLWTEPTLKQAIKRIRKEHGIEVRLQYE